jgi:endonuclease YncB( thermonuclease family)
LTVKFGSGWEIHKVIEVIDGDTIVLENGHFVRYIGIDTPETVHPNKPIECYGEQAFLKNQELVLNRYVLLERDIEDKDDYGRLLRYVYTLECSINKRLVEEGYAYSYYYPPNLKHHKQYMYLELEAKNNNMGLWYFCD